MAEGYCVKCKAKKEIAEGVEEVMKNGRKAIKGKCPTCGTVMFKILGHNSFAAVSDWSQLSQARPGDYILVLQPDKGARQQYADLQYIHQQHLLKWESGGLLVESIYGEALGQLLRVKSS